MGVVPFEAVHGITINVTYSDYTQKLFVVEKVVIDGESFKPEFLKDLWLKMNSSRPVVFLVRPLKKESSEIKLREGKLNLSPLRSEWKALQSLGKIVWNAQQFKVRYVKGAHGLSLRLRTVFRDTRQGTTHQLEIRWGLYLNSKLKGGVQALQQSYHINGKEMPIPPGTKFRWAEDYLRFFYKDYLILEVKL
jgi:hypothetical protein